MKACDNHWKGNLLLFEQPVASRIQNKVSLRACFNARWELSSLPQGGRFAPKRSRRCKPLAVQLLQGMYETESEGPALMRQHGVSYQTDELGLWIQVASGVTPRPESDGRTHWILLAR